MKKILLLALITLLTTPICFAQGETNKVPVQNSNSNSLTKEIESIKPAQAEDTDENIDQYFTDDAQSTDSDTKANSQPAPQTQTSTQTQTQAQAEIQPQIQYNGYLQYNEMEQEPTEEAIELEPVETAQVNFSKPKSVSSKSLLPEKKPIFSPMQDSLEPASKYAAQEYDISPVSTSYSKKYGQFSFGTSFDQYIDSARPSYTTGVFAKIEGKYLALKTVFSKNTQDYDSYSDKIYIAPELKLTKHLSLLDVMQTDVFQINKKNEVVLRYTPHMKKYADDVQFEVGVGQSFYESDYVNSSVRFSTRFKL